MKLSDIKLFAFCLSLLSIGMGIADISVPYLYSVEISGYGMSAGIFKILAGVFLLIRLRQVRREEIAPVGWRGFQVLQKKNF